MADNDDIELLQQLITHGGTQAFSLVPAALKKVVAEEQWRKRVDKEGKPFKSFEAFVEHRLWQGLETTIDDLRIYCRKYPDALKAILIAMEPGRTDGGDRRSESFQRDNVTLKRGNSVTYTLKRLKRDHPELFQQVLGGAIGVSAAAVEAGFRRKLTKFQQIMLWLPKLSVEERQQIRNTLDSMEGKDGQ